MLSWGHRADICQVDIQGQRLRLLDGGARVELVATLLELGLKPTRLDGALDWVGQNIDLCTSATASCRRGELCILRKYRLNDEFKANGPTTRLHLNLGSRDSPVCARIYDKGLEQRAAPLGWWERLEAEWKSDRAPRVARSLIDAGESWPETLTAFVLGAIDFREANGRSELDRRPRAAWWESLLQGRTPIRVSPAGQDRSFERWLGWFRTACAPRLIQCSEHSGIPPGRLVEMFAASVSPMKTHDGVLSDFLENLGSVTET